MNLLPTYLTLLCLFLFGCSQTEQKPKQKADTSIISTSSESIIKPKPVEQRPAKPAVTTVAQIDIEDQPFFLKDTSLRAPYLSAYKEYGHVSGYCQVAEKVLFYVSFNKGQARNGIASITGELILPIEYDKIYSPDATAKGLIEIDKQGKKGLFNYGTGMVIPCNFDVIFPSTSDQYIAVGQIGETYYGILADGSKTAINKSDEIPSYHKQLASWKFDAFSTSIIPLYNASEYDPVEDVAEGTGYIYTPSFLEVLDIMPEVHTNLSDSEDIDMGTTSSEAQVEQSRTIGGQLMAFVTSFYEEGIDARGYQNTSYHLFTIDQQNKLKAKEEIHMDDLYYGGPCDSRTEKVELLNDSIASIFNGSQYHFYKINPNGSLQKLKSNRTYSMSKYILLEEQHFKGCFAEHIPEEEDGMSYWIANHMDDEALDLMRNEIFADYGYRFKTEKWKTYFGNKDWYQPRYDSVDDQLTEIDKANIKTILFVKKKLKANPELAKKEKILWGAAG